MGMLMLGEQEPLRSMFQPAGKAACFEAKQQQSQLHATDSKVDRQRGYKQPLPPVQLLRS